MAEYPTAAISATLQDLSWLPGAWIGGKSGGRIEEYWTLPTGASMMGMFRWVEGEKIRFLEILTLEQEQESVFMYIKHFRAGLIGLEEKDQPITFTLVSLAPGEAVFFEVGKPTPQWLVYRHDGEGRMNVFLESERGAHKPEDEYCFTRGSLA